MSLQQQKTTPRVLQADIPRLVQGNGSLVNISLMIKAKPNINYTRYYTAFVTYDQGSNTGGYLLKPPEYGYYIVLFSTYIGAFIGAIYYLRRLFYKRKVRKFWDMLEHLKVYHSYVSQYYRHFSRIRSYTQRRRYLENVLELSDRIRKRFETELREVDYDWLIGELNVEVNKINDELNTLDQDIKEYEKRKEYEKTKKDLL